MRIRNATVGLANIFVGVVELFLGFRFLLKLFGANADNGFVGWIYEMSDALLDPFRSIFPVKVFENQYVVEFSTLFAMLIYALIGLLLIWLIAAITPRDTVVTKRR